MMQQEQYMQQLSFSLAIIIIVLVLLYYLYRRKNKLYLSIVKQNQEAIKRETKLNIRIKELEHQNNNPEKYASSSLTDEKSSELFCHLERLMRENKIYRDNTINKDKVSELLGTNRTYLSRIINEQTGYASTENMSEEEAESIVLRAIENAKSLESDAPSFIHKQGDTYLTYETKESVAPSAAEHSIFPRSLMKLSARFAAAR